MSWEIVLGLALVAAAGIWVKVKGKRPPVDLSQLYRPDGVAPPAYPRGLVKVDRAWVRDRLRAYGLPSLGQGADKQYELLTAGQWREFEQWYQDHRPYTPDDYDCDDSAWLKRAAVILWSRGRALYGFIEGYSTDPAHIVPHHAWNWCITADGMVYYTDELSVAVPRDELRSAYSVNVTDGYW